METLIQIEIVYISSPTTEERAQPSSVFHIKKRVPLQTTIEEALNNSPLYELHPETRALPVGIFSKLKSLDTIVQEGDRIEIYRPLTLDPKEKRRQRA